MGMSLFISGSLQDPAVEAACLEFSTVWARDNDWLVDRQQRRLAKVQCGNQTLETAQFRGMTLVPHPGCEAVPLIFLGAAGVLVDAYLEDLGKGRVKAHEGALLKTLFAGVDTHRDLCEFLHELRNRFIPSLVVDDETGFFQTGDAAALQAAHESGWAIVRAAFLARDSAGDDVAEIGGLNILRSERGKAVAEFAKLKANDRAMLEALETDLRTNYGGLGLQFPNSADGLMDLDLLMDEADDQELAKKSTEPVAEQLVHCVGAGLGRTLIALHGGHWVRGEETGMELANLGDSGLRFDPFQCAADRLIEGPMHSFVSYNDLIGQFARNLGTGRARDEA